MSSTPGARPRPAWHHRLVGPLRALLVLVVLLGSGSFPAGADSAGRAEDATETRRDLRETRERLSDARVSLAELDRRLDRAQHALSDVDARLSAATADLRRLNQSLAEAERRRASASGEVQRVGRRLKAADAALSAVVASRKAHQQQLNRRVAAVYKTGASWGAALVSAPFLRSGSLHDLAVGVHTVRSVMARDRRAVREAQRLALEAVQARREVAELRQAALRQHRQAAEARADVRRLVDRQQAAVEEIRDQRERRRRILDRLAADRRQTTVLVRRLTETASRLTNQLNAVLAAQADARLDGPVPSWAASLPQSGRRWAPAIAGAAARAGIDARLFAAVVWAESYFQPGAVSAAGAIGLAQLMPGTAQALGVDPWDPRENLLGGARYLRAMLDRFSSTDLALAAYNAGPNAVERAGRRVPDIVETQLYLLRVFTYWERLLNT